MESRRTTLFETKSRGIPISQEMVLAAYKKVRKNKGSAGIDGESLQDYAANLKDNLYKLWNRLSSGSYFPQKVRAVEIPKSNGKVRKLGIPTVSDRIAQEVIKTYLEPRLEKEFVGSSYGYRPMRNAHQALSEVKENVRDYAWVVDMDIKSFFDEVSHELLGKALEKHVPERWAKMYINRWLSVSQEDENKKVGTPQGGVISPLLANLYLHYAFDKWMQINYPNLPFVRYADDIIIHCRTEEESKQVLKEVEKRLNESKLRLSKEKTKIVHCLSYKSKKVKDYPRKFDFLGFSFKPVTIKAKNGGLFTGYDCMISQKSQSKIIEVWKKLEWHRNPSMTLQKLAIKLNPQIRGIMNYYGKFNYWQLKRLFQHLHYRIVRWLMRQNKRFRYSNKRAFEWLRKIKKSYPYLFHHWQYFKYV